MEKTVYSYKADGVYTGSIVLDESDKSPLEPDVWLLPGSCTEIEPPEDKEGYHRVFKDGVWGYSEIPKQDPEAVRRQKQQEVIHLLQAFLDDGFYFMGHWYRSDTRSKLQYLSMVSLGDDVFCTMPISPICSKPEYFTPSAVKTLLAAAVRHEQELIAAAEEHRLGLEITSDPIGYDIRKGWPSTFSQGNPVSQ